MIDNRGIRMMCTAGLIGLASVGWAPSPAAANPLLSGYGGPGQGSQAILGSAIVGGGSGAGGGGGGGSTSGGSQGGGSVSSQASGASGAGEPHISAGPAGSVTGGGANARGGSAGAGRGTSTSATRTGTKTARRGSASGGVAGAYPTVSAERAYLARASGSGGLSAIKLGYVLLALVVLACVAVLTRRLVWTDQKEQGGHQSLKGRVVGPE